MKLIKRRLARACTLEALELNKTRIMLIKETSKVFIIRKNVLGVLLILSFAGVFIACIWVILAEPQYYRLHTQQEIIKINYQHHHLQKEMEQLKKNLEKEDEIIKTTKKYIFELKNSIMPSVFKGRK